MPNLKIICRNLAKHGLYVDLLNPVFATEMMTIHSASRFVIEVRAWTDERHTVLIDLPGTVDELGWPIAME